MYYLLGLMFLALAKIKHVLKGYSTPKPIDISETDECIDYDLDTVNKWLEHLPVPLDGKHALELGPGSDLGVGLYLLHRGAARYSACDVNALAHRVPPAFYTAFFKRIEAEPWLESELEKSRAGRPEKLHYIVNDRFDLSAVAPVDVVFSQAAFEHFDDVDDTVRQLTSVCKPGAVIVAEVDLMTHSRWIREKDPLNIYRYPEWLYRLFHFRGQPNRVRPSEYKRIFEKHGWKDVSIEPLTTAGRVPVELRHIDPEISYLTILITGRHGPPTGGAA